MLKEIVRSKSLRTICFKTSGLSELLGNKVKTNDNIEKEKEQTMLRYSLVELITWLLKVSIIMFKNEAKGCAINFKRHRRQA